MGDRALFQPSGFFVLRSPLFPVGAFEPTPSGLRSFIERPVVQEAIFLASPSLDARLEDAEGEDRSSIDAAVFQYATRMCSRPTPFGLFAGCSVGELGERTSIALAPRSAYRVHARIAPEVLCSIVEAVTDDEAARRTFTFRTTPSLYEAAGKLRYELRSDGDRISLLDVEPEPLLLLALRRASAAPVALAELASAVQAGCPGLSTREASAFVDQLVTHRLLVPTLLPAVTGPGAVVAPIAAAFATTGTLAHHAAGLERAAHALQEAGAPGEARDRYREAHVALGTLPGVRGAGARIDAALVKPLAHGSLGPAPVRELLRVVDLLNDVVPPAPFRLLDRFVAAFLARYDGREVPLVEVLDPESGIAFDEDASRSDLPFLEGLTPGNPVETRTWTARDAFVAGKLHEALRRGSAIEIGDADRAAGGVPRRLPGSFVALATLMGHSGEAVDRGEFEIHEPKFVTPAAGLLGRFCHADPALEARARQHIAREEAAAAVAGVIVADVVHLSPGRSANIQVRSQLYTYEIVCHGTSGAPVERQIPVSDLLISVRSGAVELRSARLDKRIVPRISCMHAESGDGSAVYRFLHALQAQEGILASWSWGALAGAEVLPRVRTGRTVLALATWNLSQERLRGVLEARGALRARAMLALRDELAIPRHIAVIEGDRALPLDTESPLALDVLARLARSVRSVRIREVDASAGLLVSSPEGRFTHEIAVPFVRSAPEPPIAARRPTRAGGARTFGPGSDVLYARVYAARSTFDALLTEVVGPLVATAKREGIAERWLFVRYADAAGSHLRLRIFGSRRLWAETLPALHDALAPWVASDRVHRVEVGTYTRELERYGGPLGMDLAERIFEADAETCLELLGRLARADEAPEDRLWLLVAGWDALFADLGLDLPARLALTRAGARRLAGDLGVRGAARHALDRTVRGLVQEAERRLGPAGRAGDPATERFAARSQRLGPILAALREGCVRGAVTVPLEELALSYVHMSANRLLVSSPREQELVAHEVLSRTYRATLARHAPADPHPRTPEESPTRCA